MKKNMIFFLFPVVGLYSFHLFHLFIPCSSSSFFSCHSLYTKSHTHLSQLNSNSFISLFYLSTTKKSKLAKKKREKENKKRIYNKFQHMYTLSLSSSLSLAHSLDR